MEFKSSLDIEIAEKMFRHPLLGEELPRVWTVKFDREFDMTNDSDLFKSEPDNDRHILYEGKMIWQFQHGYAQPRYWLEEAEARNRLLKNLKDAGQKLAYQNYRVGFRDVAASTNERTLISTLVPKNHFCGNTLPTLLAPTNPADMLTIISIFNAFCTDWLIRQKVTNHCNFFYMQQLPVPRLNDTNASFGPLVERAARLVGTSSEYDDLLREIFGPKATHKTHGVTDAQDRLTLRAEIDALVARLYDLTAEEFQHILSTFPLVDESVKSQTLNTYRDLLALGKLTDNRI